ncbi:hypothetical protein N7513_003504 [Penicillium frequentans]|nr:hypothetical protein N7513_003504 [Penicillium glabrum]
MSGPTKGDVGSAVSKREDGRTESEVGQRPTETNMKALRVPSKTLHVFPGADASNGNRAVALPVQDWGGRYRRVQFQGGFTNATEYAAVVFDLQ